MVELFDYFLKFLPIISSFYPKKVDVYGSIPMPTACRMPTALIGKMPDADGIAKTRHNDQYRHNKNKMILLHIPKR